MNNLAFILLMGQPTGGGSGQGMRLLPSYRCYLYSLFSILHDKASDEKTERNGKLQELSEKRR